MTVPQADRGCVFFNFGDAYALRLLVSVFSLRQVYAGPVTVLLAPDAAGEALRAPLEGLGCEVASVGPIHPWWDRHRLFHESPYAATLGFDSDLIFLAPIDELWSPLEREGLLATRFFPNPHGVDGTPTEPGWANRVGHLDDVRGLVDRETYATAARRLVEERIDVNVGVMGVARPQGDAFLADWSDRMERGKPDRIPLMDEMLVVALLAEHRHALVDEVWNCPAAEFFRRTNLADARIIHYFADGLDAQGIALGRNRSTWAGVKWYELYRQAAEELDLDRWARLDPTFRRPRGPLATTGTRAVRSAERRTAAARMRVRRLMAPAVRPRRRTGS